MACDYQVGTWISFGVWIYKNFFKIKKFVEHLNENYTTETTLEIFQIINTKTFEEEIKKIGKLDFLPIAIKSLESDDLSTFDQIKKVK